MTRSPARESPFRTFEGARVAALTLLLVFGCAGEDPVAPDEVDDADRVPPGAIDDLSVSALTPTSVTLTWSAPGDDGHSGRAETYDFRYSVVALTLQRWPEPDVERVVDERTPKPAGEPESLTVSGLHPATNYHFAVRSADDRPNWSPLSNVVSGITMFEGGDPPAGMVPIPAGGFLMGGGQSRCGRDERPVILTHPFCLAEHEVTNADYIEAVQWAYDHRYVEIDGSVVEDRLDGCSLRLLFLDDPVCEIAFGAGTFSLRDAGHGPDNGDYPVRAVSWYGAAAYCDWKSLMAGIPRAYDHATWECNGGDPYVAPGFRLPTDAEWEYAARFDDGRCYPWGSSRPTCVRANVLDCVGWTTPVKSFPGCPRIDGMRLYDLVGNVWEWCNDRFECHVGEELVTDPTGPSTGATRVAHGGSCYETVFNLESSVRAARDPVGPGVGLGFRVARTR